MDDTAGSMGDGLNGEGFGDSGSIGGEIIYAGYSDGNGYHVVVKHTLPDGTVFYSFYSHMKEGLLVQKGDYVSAGAYLGIMGNTGFSLGAHLHLGIYTGPVSTDPAGTYRDSNRVKVTMGQDAIGQGYVEYGGRTYYDPMRVVETKGAIIKR